MLSLYRVFVLSFLTIASISAGFSQTSEPGSEEYFQELYKLTNERVDPNQRLLNGIYYENPYHDAIGHPFLNEGDFHQGSVIFQGTRFDQVRMKYDVYQQQLLISPKADDPMMMILLSNEFLSEFYMGEAHFKKHPLDEEGNTFYQVIWEEEHIKCFYTWYRFRYKEVGEGAHTKFRFSDLKHNRYLEINGKLSRYKNKGSFLKLIPREIKSQVKAYLKTNAIKLNTADMEQIKAVLQYCQKELSQTNMQIN